jgi:hypothetical protein
MSENMTDFLNRAVVSKSDPLVSIVVPDPVYVGLAVPTTGRSISALYLSQKPFDAAIHPNKYSIPNTARVGLASTTDGPLRLNWIPFQVRARSVAANEERKREINAKISALRAELENL